MAKRRTSGIDSLFSPNVEWPDHWRDTGCDLAPSCLRCPFVRCQYDEPGGQATFLRAERNRSIQEMWRGGTPSR